MGYEHDSKMLARREAEARSYFRQAGAQALPHVAGMLGWERAAQLLEEDIRRRMNAQHSPFTDADIRRKVADALREHGQDDLAKRWEGR